MKTISPFSTAPYDTGWLARLAGNCPARRHLPVRQGTGSLALRAETTRRIEQHLHSAPSSDTTLRQPRPPLLSCSARPGRDRRLAEARTGLPAGSAHVSGVTRRKAEEGQEGQEASRARH